MWSTTTSISGKLDSLGGRIGDAGALFIAFEGIEGAGKSTQIALVAEALRQRGRDPLVTREPGGTATGEAIRAVALDNDLKLDAVAETLLMLAARAVFVREIVRPALQSGRLVLTDRYELSTFAYQGGGRGLPLAELKELNRLATRGLRPDLCVLLDVDPDQGEARGGAKIKDRIEAEQSAFHHSVAEAYRELARSETNVELIDGRPGVEQVFAAVWATLSRRFPETFTPGPG